MKTHTPSTPEETDAVNNFSDYHSLFMNMSLGVVFQDTEGRIINANQAASNIFGLPLDQLLGQSVSEEWGLVKMDGTPLSKEEIPAIRALYTGKPVNHEILGFPGRPNDKHAWIVIDAVPEFLPGQEKPFRVFSTFSDITENVESARQLNLQSGLLDELVKVKQEFIGAQSENVHEVIQNSIARLGHLMEADRFYIMDYDWAHGICNNTYEWCAEGISPQIQNLQEVPVDMIPNWVNTHRDGKVMLIQDVEALSKDDPLRELLESQDILSLVAVPVMKGDACIGFVGLDSVYHKHFFSEAEINLLKVFSASLLNLKVRLAKEKDLLKTQFNLQERLKEMRCLYELNQLPIHELTISQMLEKAVQLIPAGFQDPEHTCAKISYNGMVFTTPDYAENGNELFMLILDDDTRVAGEVRVVNPPGLPFLKEEGALMDGIRQFIEQWVYRQNLNTKLKQNEERWRTLINSQTTYLIRTNLEGKLTFWNAKYESDFGWLYEKSSMAHGDPLDAVCPRHHQRLRDVVTECIQEPGKIFKCELDKPKPGGEVMYTLWEFVCLQNEQGVPYEIQCSGQDISSHMLAEMENRKNEAKYRSVVESSDAAILIISPDGEYLFMNGKAANELGRSPESMVGKTLADVLPREEVEAVLDQYRRVLAENKGETFVASFTVMGKVRWYRTSLQPLLDSEGKPYAVLVNSTNITEIRKAQSLVEESEARYRVLFEDAPEAFLIIRDGHFVDCNNASLKLMQCSREELLGKTPQDLSPEYQPNGKKSDEYAEVLLAKAFEEGAAEFEWVHVRFNGTLFIASISLKIITLSGEKMVFVSWQDITEQKQLQDNLLRNEKRLREIAENSRTVIWEFDETGILTYVSEVSNPIFGFAADDVIGKLSFNAFFHAGEGTNDFDAITKELIANHSQVKDLVLPMTRRDGQIIYVSVDATPMFRNDGTFIGYRGSSRDVTERYKNELEVRKFRAIADQANYGTALNTLDGTFLYVNPKWAQMHGYTQEELLGKNLMIGHSEEQLRLVLPVIQEMMHTGGFDAMEIDHVRKDGSVLPTLMSAKIIKDADGKPSFLSATCIDISEKKENEKEVEEQRKKMAAIIDALPDMIFVNNANGDYLEYYRSEHNSLVGDYGYLIGSNIRDAFPEETANLHLTQIAKCLKEGRVQAYEYPKFEDGINKWFEVRAVKFADDRVMRFIRDVTHRKEQEHEIIELNKNLEFRIQERTAELQKTNEHLRKATEEAERANQSKSEFLSRMSHELRTPLNSILGFAQLLEMGALTEQQAKGIRHILKSGTHLLNLINEVLDITKIEAGRISLSLEPVELSGLILDVTETLQPLTREKEVILDFDPVPVGHKFVRADRQRLRQIMINLCNNAIKYNHSGGRVWVDVEEQPVTSESDSKYIRISVSDNGPGISQEGLQKLFRPFERVNAEGSTIEGTGLGLSVVKKLVALMGGQVGVYSVEGEGSCFWVELPEEEHPSNGLKKEGVFNSPELPVEAVHSGTMLYIEDNLSNIELLQQLLSIKRPDLKLVTATTGNKGVEMAIEVQPDLVLLDLNLPDLHGSDVLQRLRSFPNTNAIPVIILSADAMPEMVKKLQKLGCNGYLTKPLNVELLLKQLDMYLIK